MQLKTLFPNLQITGVSLNTQTLKAGDVFVALQGAKWHGIDFIQEAIQHGCVAVITEGLDWSGNVPSKRVDCVKQYLPLWAENIYPKAKQQKIVGITGTNGKTSVASFISQLLNHLGHSSLMIGTLSGQHTTPDIFSLYRQLNDCTAEFVVLEVSSHALDQGRVTGLNFEQAIFTNLTQDHLDYHQNMDNYRDAKSKLFTVDSLNTIVLNRDDPQHTHFLQVASDKPVVLYSRDDFSSIAPKPFGFLLQLQQFVFEVNLLGQFNLSNLLAAFHGVCSLGFASDEVIPLLPKLHTPTGRMQKIKHQLVWVDYAHTPNALENAIITLKTHYPTHQIRVLFGCGGNRDQDKRAKMGRIASNLAHSLILSNDNPRDESPSTIIADILSGIDDSYPVEVIEDRQLAIETAITTLADNECLLIAGKGHETTQQFQDKIINLSDIDIAQHAAS